MAEMGEDGLVLANLPAHTLGDGDSIFGLSTHKVGLVCDSAGECGPDESQPDVNCEQEANLDTSVAGSCAGLLRDIYSATTPTLARAFAHAVLNATSTHGLDSYCDTFPSAQCGQGASNSSGQEDGDAAVAGGGSDGSAVQPVSLASEESARAPLATALPYVLTAIAVVVAGVVMSLWWRRHHGMPRTEPLALE